MGLAEKPTFAKVLDGIIGKALERKPAPDAPVSGFMELRAKGGQEKESGFSQGESIRIERASELLSRLREKNPALVERFMDDAAYRALEEAGRAPSDKDLLASIKHESNFMRLLSLKASDEAALRRLEREIGSA